MRHACAPTIVSLGLLFWWLRVTIYSHSKPCPFAGDQYEPLNTINCTGNGQLYNGNIEPLLNMTIKG